VILGMGDQHLNQLDKAFPATKITARGNRVKILGPDAEVEAIAGIINEMISVGRKNGQVTSRDMGTLLALADKAERSTGKSSEPAQPFIHDTGDIILHTHTGEAVTAKTPGQRAIINASEKNDILFAIGPAGTGKTYTSVALAVRALKERKVKKIILARPAVEAGENLGFLPGDLKEKIDPYLRPLYDALEEMIEFDKLEFQLAKNVIEIAPLAYMRGRTLNNAFVILDEAQNATNTQMKMFLTRIGFNSRAIITGDITQTDLPKKQESGLISIQRILQNIEGISFVYLDQGDVVRHKLVRDIIDAYEKFESKNR
jgi:phosphate starvation-inducible protein PhoH and related proteins